MYPILSSGLFLFLLCTRGGKEEIPVGSREVLFYEVLISFKSLRDQ